MSKELIRE